MGHLDRLIRRTIETELVPEKLASKLIAKKLAEHGAILSDAQLLKLEHDLNIDQLGSVEIDLEDEQMAKLEGIHDAQSGKIMLHFDDQEIDSLEDRIEKAIGNSISEAVSVTSDALVATWKSQAAKQLRHQRTERTRFERRIREAWGEALDSLDILLSVCLEEGAEFNTRFRRRASRKNDFVFDVLTRSHARGCQIGSEILSLLRNGFADGALARWRTLHEITVIAMFVRQGGNDVAERYLVHTDITNFHDARHYQNHYQTLGFDPVSTVEIDELTAVRNDLLLRYGKDFDNDYGWASKTLNKTRPTFSEIESSVDLAHMRPFYRLANINVHAGSKGILYRLGSADDKDMRLLAGSSVFGLADPGQNTAISLNQLTATMLLLRSNLDHLSFLTATQKLVQDILNQFAVANERLTKESKASD